MTKISTADIKGLTFDDVIVGDEITPVSIPITYKRVCMNAAATWDWFPGHHDPEYARSQGQRTIYLSTLFFHGFIDRGLTDWAGPDALLRRRKISMIKSIYPTDRDPYRAGGGQAPRPRNAPGRPGTGSVQRGGHMRAQ